MKSKLTLVIFALLFQLACVSVPIPALFAPTETVVPTSTSVPATPTLPPPPDVTPIPSETPLSPPRLFQQVTLTAEGTVEATEPERISQTDAERTDRVPPTPVGVHGVRDRAHAVRGQAVDDEARTGPEHRWHGVLDHQQSGRQV